MFLLFLQRIFIFYNYTIKKMFRINKTVKTYIILTFFIKKENFWAYFFISLSVSNTYTKADKKKRRKKHLQKKRKRINNQ